MPQAKIIEDAVIAPVSPPDPPNGVETREIIRSAFNKLLDGEHGLFSVGRSYPGMRFTVTLVMETFGKDSYGEEFVSEREMTQTEGEQGVTAGAADSSMLEAVGDTTRPEEARRAAGLPVAEPEVKAVEQEFTPSAGDEKDPIRIKRGKGA
jgi:hypothetical protein